MAGSARVGAIALEPVIALGAASGDESSEAVIEQGLDALEPLIAEVAVAPASGGLLSRRLRELGAAAATLEWPVATELSRCEALVQGATVFGALPDGAIAQLRRTRDLLAAALRAERERERTPTSGPLPHVATSARRTTAVLSVPVAVVGPRALAQMLRSPEADGCWFAVSRVGRAEQALARIIAAGPLPQVIVADGDEPGADALIEDWLSDARTEAIPLVVVGTWHSPEQAARFVALGAARCIAKPLAAGELRRACAQLSPAERQPFDPIGEATLDEIGARLADELHRGLCDAAADDRARKKRVDIGDGSAVLTVLWDALARIRQLLAAGSGGELAFRERPRDQALPVGLALTRPSLRDASDRSRFGGRCSDEPPAIAERPAGEPAAARGLFGLSVLVCDGDLSSNWFLSGVLREAGAMVLSAFDGKDALAQAFAHAPDAVMTALPLGGLDGFGLARMLHDDVLLRDAPVLLLAGDVAEARRIQELGHDGAHAMLKGATGPLVLQRLRELLRPRLRLGARIAGAGPVDGRLGDISAIGLVAMTARVRPNARVSIQPGDWVHEIEIRAGLPVRACCTRADGELIHGAEALSELLPVCSGRFRVDSAEEPVSPNLDDGLYQLLAPRIARIREVQASVSGAALMSVGRVVFDLAALSGLLASTPEPAKSALASLIAGQSPRAMIARGEVPAALLEAILIDAARRMAIAEVVRSVESFGVHVESREVQLYSSEVQLDSSEVQLDSSEVQLDSSEVQLDSSEVQVYSSEVKLESSEVKLYSSELHLESSEVKLYSSKVQLESIEGNVAPFEPDPEAIDFDLRASQRPRLLPRPSSPPPALTHADWRPPWALLESDEPEEEDESVEISEAEERPEQGLPALHRALGSVREPLLGYLAPLTLGSRAALGPRDPSEARMTLGSRPAERGSGLTPILVSRLGVSQQPPRRAQTPILSSVASCGAALAKLDEPSAPAARAEPAAERSERAIETPAERAKPAPEPELAVAAVAAAAPSAPPRREAAPSTPIAIADVGLPRSIMPSSYVPRSAPAAEKKPPARSLGPALFAAAGIALAIGARLWRREPAPALPSPPLPAMAPAQPVMPPAPAAMPPAIPPAAAAISPPQAPVASTSQPSTGQPQPPAEAVADGVAPQELPLTGKERRKIVDGQGLVEIVAGRGDDIQVDGKHAGQGPVLRLFLAAGSRHEVRVILRGDQRSGSRSSEERVRYVTPKEGVKLRLRVAPPWSR